MSFPSWWGWLAHPLPSAFQVTSDNLLFLLCVYNVYVNVYNAYIEPGDGGGGGGGSHIKRVMNFEKNW